MNASVKCFYLIIILFLISCNKCSQDKIISNVLIFDANSSSQNKPFFRDSLFVTYYKFDSIIIKNYFNGDYYQNVFLNQEKCFFENRYVSNLPEGIFKTDTILTFAKMDTTFVYKSRRDDFIVTFVDLSLFDCQYFIEKIGKEYVTTKQSLIDSTYKEIFFYNKDYQIYKFINTWKDSKCVYVKKE